VHKHFALSAARLLTGKPSEERSEARAPIALFLADVTPMEDRSTATRNSHITVSGIPHEAHEYMPGSRAGAEW